MNCSGLPYPEVVQLSYFQVARDGRGRDWDGEAAGQGSRRGWDKEVGGDRINKFLHLSNLEFMGCFFKIFNEEYFPFLNHIYAFDFLNSISIIFPVELRDPIVFTLLYSLLKIRYAFRAF